jgi:hypothetical protein
VTTSYHLLTIVHVFTPHLSCFQSLFTTTEATTLIAASKPRVKRSECEHGLSPSSSSSSQQLLAAGEHAYAFEAAVPRTAPSAFYVAGGNWSQGKGYLAEIVYTAGP